MVSENHAHNLIKSTHAQKAVYEINNYKMRQYYTPK